MRAMISRLMGKQSFLKNILTLMTGTAITQAIIVGITPILSRLYSPGDFGVLSIYVSILSILAGIVCWRYDIGIVLPVGKKDAMNMAQVAVLSAFATSLLSLGLAGAFRVQIASLMKSPGLAAWLWVLPFNLFAMGVIQVLSYWATRNKKFETLQKTSVVRTLAGTLIRLAAGVSANLNSVGLLGGQVLSDFLGATSLVFSTDRMDRREFFEDVRKDDLIKIARQYSDLPLNSFFTVFLNSISANAIPLFITWMFNPYLTGLMLFAQRSISMPISAVTNSIWQVTHAELGRLEMSDRAVLFSRVHKFTSYAYAFPLSAVALFGNLSGVVFGSDWVDLQYILPPIAGMLYINSVSNSTSFFAAFGYYRAESVTNIILIVARVVSLLIGAALNDFYAAIYMYCISSALVYLGVNLFWSLQLGKTAEFFQNLFVSCLVSLTMLFPLRYFFGKNLVLSLLSISVAGGLYYYLVLWWFKDKMRLSMGKQSNE